MYSGNVIEAGVDGVGINGWKLTGWKLMEFSWGNCANYKTNREPHHPNNRSVTTPREYQRNPEISAPFSTSMASGGLGCHSHNLCFLFLPPNRDSGIPADASGSEFPSSNRPQPSTSDFGQNDWSSHPICVPPRSKSIPWLRFPATAHLNSAFGAFPRWGNLRTWRNLRRRRPWILNNGGGKSPTQNTPSTCGHSPNRGLFRWVSIEMSIKIPVQSCRKIRHRQNANPATRLKRFANSAKFIHRQFRFGAANFKLRQSSCGRLLIMALREGSYSMNGCQSPCGRFWPQVRAGQTQHELSLHQCYRRNSSSKPTCLAHFRWPTPTKTIKFFGIPQSSADSSHSMIDSKCPKTWQDSTEKACSRPASTATFKP
jgi:hypothetical protein